jgi:UDP-N-acetylmuramyl pentapeptide phosphotransferase/UDP-N-acetylglucosamine-1-phosphate transferase
MATDPTPGAKPPAAKKPPTANTQPAMTPHAIGVALFAAFVVGGILAKVVPLWVVVLVGLVVGATLFVLVDRYPRLPGRGWTRRD